MFVDRFGQPGADLRPYALRPGFSGSYVGGRVRIDDEGERVVVPAKDVDATFAQATLNETILLLGDSVAFGQAVDDEDTPASQLQSELLRRGKHIRVRNAAAPGYTSWNERAVLEDYFTRHDARWVVLFYVWNDPTFDDDHLKLHDGIAIQSDSLLHRLTRSLYDHVYSSFFVADSVKRLAWAITSTRDSPAWGFSEKELSHSMEAVRAMRELCEKRGASLLVGLVRDVTAYEDEASSHAYEARVGAALDASGTVHFTMGTFQEKMTLGEARASWSDLHPSPAAVQWMVSDVIQALGL